MHLFFIFIVAYGIISPMKTLVILAGGKSTRMGKDKIFLHLHDNETFLEHLYHKASDSFDRIIISAGSLDHAAEIQNLLPDAELVPDKYVEKGPMGGLVSVYEQTGASRFAVVPVDVPFADIDVLSFFFDHCMDTACVLMDGEHAEPLIGAYGIQMLEKLKGMLERGDYRMYASLSEGVNFYSFAALQKQMAEKDEVELRAAFCNINTESDYRNYVK